MSKEIAIFGAEGQGKFLSIESDQAVQTIMTGKIPDYAIQEHPGRGGKMFKYISHVFVSRMLNAAFGARWSSNIDRWQMFDDYSAAVQLTLRVDFERPDGTNYRREVTEIGAFEAQIGQSGKPGMSNANIVAAAASRALVRCVMRAFNVGAEFYEDDNLPKSNREAYNKLLEYGSGKGFDEAKVKEILKTAGFQPTELKDRYQEAGLAIFMASKPAKSDQELPEDLS